MDMISSIAALSMDMAQQNVQSAASLKMFKNIMDSQEAASAQMVEAIEQIPMPTEGVGSLLDVRA
ncbi:MAG: putative motility protein [Ruminococcaceae bacterium]|nr:putative motility protein [Oscillospiraceae bacterium]